MHWTLGGAVPAACKYASTAKPTAGSNLLHIALESNAAGWIGAAFPRLPNTMVPADGMIGWMAANGSASVGAYYLGVRRRCWPAAGAGAGVVAGPLSCCLAPGWRPVESLLLGPARRGCCAACGLLGCPVPARLLRRAAPAALLPAGPEQCVGDA